MGYLAGGPIANISRTVLVTAATFDGQRAFAIPGGFQPGMTDVYVGGANSADYDDSDGMQVVLTSGVAVGTAVRIVAYNPTLVQQPVGGQLAGFRNQLINGNFDWWQRGTSRGAGGDTYLADRWLDSASGTTVAPSQQAFTLGQTTVPFEPTFFHRSVIASVAGAGNFGRFVQRLEGVRALAGQQVVVSFWAKADASKNIAFEASQYFGSSGSAGVTGIGVTTCALTTAWKQFKVPFLMPSIAGKTIGGGNDFVEIGWWFDAGSNFNSRANSLGQQSGTFDIAQVQLEAGSVATPFEIRPRGTELALCQRFFYSSYPPDVVPGTISVPGVVAATAVVTGIGEFCPLSFPVTMRAIPTITVYSPVTGTAGQVRDYTATADVAGQGIGTGQYGIRGIIGGPTAGHLYQAHITAAAEL